MTDYTVAPATPLELATERVHEAMYEAWNDPNPPREEAETEAARKVLAAALDHPDVAPMIRDWRMGPCEHYRTDVCSPCLRDRLRAYLLGGTS